MSDRKFWDKLLSLYPTWQFISMNGRNYMLVRMPCERGEGEVIRVSRTLRYALLKGQR